MELSLPHTYAARSLAGKEDQEAMYAVAESANKLRETLRVYESKIRSLEFELSREKGLVRHARTMLCPKQVFAWSSPLSDT